MIRFVKLLKFFSACKSVLERRGPLRESVHSHVDESLKRYPSRAKQGDDFGPAWLR